MKDWFSQRRPGLWCAFAFIALGCGLLPYPGVQTDEALFGAAFYQHSAILDKFRAFGHDIPTMSMTYLGSLKTWLYAGIFSTFGPSVWSIRLPMLLLGGVTIFLFSRFIERLHGRTAAWVATAWLATDASLILTTTFDWGPVALQHFLQLSALYLLYRFHHETRPRLQAALLALACFALGLALWNKAIFAWTLMGTGTATVLLFPRELWQRATLRNIAIALVFFAGGASMLIRYNVRHQGATWKTNARLSLSHIRDKHIHLRSMLDGSGVYGFMINEDNYGAIRFTYGPQVLALAAGVALLRRRRAAAFPVLAAILTWLAMASTADGGGSIHHAILLYPFGHWWLAAALSGPVRLPHWRAAAITVAATFLVADNIRVLGAYRDCALRLGGGRDWSEAVFPMTQRVLARHPEQVRLYDWGMQDNLILLTARPWAITYPQRPFSEAAFADVPQALWIGHTKSRIEGINEELFAAAAKFGYQRVVLERIPNRLGQPIYELFEFRKR